MKKIAVVGGRDFTDYEYVEAMCQKNIKKGEEVLFICGKARGADTLGENFAKKYAHKYVEYAPNYLRFGRGAPNRRNMEMAKEADLVLAFWDGRSRGTKHMIDISRQLGKRVIVYPYTRWYVWFAPGGEIDYRREPFMPKVLGAVDQGSFCVVDAKFEEFKEYLYEEYATGYLGG